eukprot:428658-Rhodomonas_salina.4
MYRIPTAWDLRYSRGVWCYFEFVQRSVHRNWTDAEARLTGVLSAYALAIRCPCPVLTWRSCLRACYALSGTDLQPYSATSVESQLLAPMQAILSQVQRRFPIFRCAIPKFLCDL